MDQVAEQETQTTLPGESSLDVLADRMVEKLRVGVNEAASGKPRPEPDPGVVEKIAAICHETNRVYCLVFTGEIQNAWHLAPEWQHESAIDGVQKHLANGYRLGPVESHNAWMSLKLRDGWRYGEVKDAEAKTHPCLLPFEELPLEQQLKDALFGRIVDVLRPLAFPDERAKAEQLGALAGARRLY